MAQHRPIMAGHPATQRMKESEENGLDTTVLHIAALEGDLQRLLQILRGGLSPNVHDQSQKTPLHIAAQCEAALSPYFHLLSPFHPTSKFVQGSLPYIVRTVRGNPAEVENPLLYPFLITIFRQACSTPACTASL